MYVFQFQDATYRIALQTSSEKKFPAILANKEAFALYEGIYDTRAEAEVARRRAEALIG